MIVNNTFLSGQSIKDKKGENNKNADIYIIRNNFKKVKVEPKQQFE